MPQDFSLEQNYPNPFNPATKINYSVKKNGFIALKIFDSSGKEIETLVSETQSAGTYTAYFDGLELPSGVYYYRLTSENFSETKKMILIK